MCFGGGGGGGGGNDQTYWQNIENDRTAAARGEQQRIEQEKQNRIANYNAMLTAALGKAPERGNQYASSIGLDPNNANIQSIINQIIGDISPTIQKDQDSSIDPAQFFSGNAFGQGFSDFQDRTRRANTANVSNTFKTGYESTLLPDDMINSIIDQILGEQKGLAGTQVDYQQKRGLLNDTGYGQAQKTLGTQSEAARGTLSSLARAELDKDRGSLKDIMGEAGTAASNWMIGNDPFSLDPFSTRLNTRADQEKSTFGGDVRAALGDTQLFDIPSIVAQAGIAQGAQNLVPGSDPANAFGPKKKQAFGGRGLGTTGEF